MASDIRGELPRLRKGRDPFTPVMLGCLLIATGIVLFSYSENMEALNIAVAELLAAYGIIFTFFGVLRMRYPWLRVKGKYHTTTGLALLATVFFLSQGLLKTLSIILLLAGIALIGYSLKQRVRKHNKYNI